MGSYRNISLLIGNFDRPTWTNDCTCSKYTNTANKMYVYSNVNGSSLKNNFWCFWIISMLKVTMWNRSKPGSSEETYMSYKTIHQWLPMDRSITSIMCTHAPLPWDCCSAPAVAAPWAYYAWCTAAPGTACSPVPEAGWWSGCASGQTSSLLGDSKNKG